MDELSGLTNNILSDIANPFVYNVREKLNYDEAYMRKKVIEYVVCVVLSSDADKRKVFSRIRKLYEMIDPQNELLIKERSRKGKVTGDFKFVVIRDIMALIGYQCSLNKVWLSELIDMYKQIYPRTYEWIEELTQGKHTIEQVIKYDQMLDGHDRGFFRLCIYSSDVLWKEYSQPFRESDFFSQLEYDVGGDAYRNLSYLDNVYLQGEDEVITNTIYYQKYLKKNRQKLADYLHIEVSKLSEFINHILLRTSTEEYITHENFQYQKTKLYARQIFCNHLGSPMWYDLVFADKIEEFKGLHYRCDVDKLIEDYYGYMILEKYLECKIKNETYNKIILARETAILPAETDLQNILYLCMADGIYKFADTLMDDYYRNYSFENSNKSDRINRLINEINGKDLKLESLITQNEDLKQQLFSFKQSQFNKNKNDIYAYEKQVSSMEKMIEDKNDLILSLKEKLQIQNEYISKLENSLEIEEDNSEELDISILFNKKFLIVGHIEGRLPELKHLFSNSFFLEDETQNISNISCDAIVYLIRYMSHSMFYKIKATGYLQDKPMIFCNTRTKNSIIHEITKFYDGELL